MVMGQFSPRFVPLDASGVSISIHTEWEVIGPRDNVFFSGPRCGSRRAWLYSFMDGIVKFGLKIPDRLGKMSEKLGREFFDSHSHTAVCVCASVSVSITICASVDSAPSLGVYYFLSLTLSVCMSGSPSVTLLLQIASFLFLDAIEPFSGPSVLRVALYKIFSSISDLGPLTPKIYSPKFALAQNQL